jgi:cell division cycle 2-like protein
MTSSTTSSSTPRKRSRWEDESAEQNEIQPVVHKKKHRSTKAAEPVAAAPPTTVDEDDEDNAPKRPMHSYYVPPRTEHPALAPSRSVYCYERLNQIEEGSYGIVFRARDKETGDVVALKKLKLDEETAGFPITALREVLALMRCAHDNVVRVREVVVGDTLTQYVPHARARSARV